MAKPNFSDHSKCMWNPLLISRKKERNIHVKHVSATVDTATIQTTLTVPYCGNSEIYILSLLINETMPKYRVITRQSIHS